MNRSIMLVALLVVSFVSSAVEKKVAGGRTVAVAEDIDALLYVPDVNYRKEWVMLGSFSILGDEPARGAKQIHVVYATRETVDAYLSTGKFPDGAVLVKDVFGTVTEPLSTGIVSYAGALAGRFVMVKDRAGRDAGNASLWGDGWGWAFYEGTEMRKTATTDYRKDCLACHEPARNNDLVYIQGYPILKR